MTRSEAMAIVDAYIGLCEKVAEATGWPGFSTDYPLEIDEVGLFLTETQIGDCSHQPGRGRYLRLS